MSSHRKFTNFISFLLTQANTNFQMFDIAYHLYCVSSVFCESFEPKHVPNEALIRHWLRGYYEESNRMDQIQMTEDDFEQLIDDELKKVLANMLIVRILLIQTALLYIFNIPGNLSVKVAVKYAVDIYADFAKNRDQHLKLLDTLRQ